MGDPRCGAINSFLGIVRNLEGAEPIEALFYEAYEPMAKKQMSEIVEIVLDNCKAENESKAYVMVRLGKVPVGQASIYICVSSKGRYWSHRATIDILQRIKSTVAIWKKAIYCDGREEWVDESKSEAWWLQ